MSDDQTADVNELFSRAMDSSARLAAARKAAGVVSVGGWFSTPDYLGSYLKAATTLTKIGHEAGQLDELAMPILYMQRHTLELAVKFLLWDLHRLADNDNTIEKTKGATSRLPVASKSARERAVKCHDLKSLLNDLRSVLRQYETAGWRFHPLPASLESLVNRYEELEKNEASRFRYPFVMKVDRTAPKGSTEREPKEQRSFDGETTIEVMSLQADLDLLLEELGLDEDSISHEIYIELGAQSQEMYQLGIL